MRTRLSRDLPATQNDSGIVAIWTALLLVVFMGMAAIAVDISRWYVEMARVQNAVDAAALAGVVHMPGSIGQATSAAQAVVTANGWDGTKAQVEPGSRASQLRVSLSSTVNNPFGAVLGTGQTTITRTAVADFAGPVPMGSPCNVFGNEAMESTDKWGSTNCEPDERSQYWLHIAGKNVNKARGDAYAAAYCGDYDGNKKTDGCSHQDAVVGGGKPPSNVEYTADGYIFVVRTKAPGPLSLQAYDIGFFDAKCNVSDKKCTGDNFYTGPGQSDQTAGKTRVTVRKPSPNPWNPLDGEVVCTQTYDGQKDKPNYAGYDSFQRWVDLCAGKIGTVQANQDYSIQVQTIDGGGLNRFALRAGLGSRADNKNVSIFAHERFSLQTAFKGDTYVKFVRLDSSAAGRTLLVRLFDLGDNGTIQATVLKPDSDVPFSGCIGSGPVSAGLAGCQVTLKVEDYGSRWQQIAVPIPSDYACSNDADQSACWVKVRLNPVPSGSSIDDITTWGAQLVGDPVRLVE